MYKKAFMIQEMEIVYSPSRSVVNRPKITTSQSAYSLLKKLYNPNTISCQEEFMVLYLNNSNTPLGVYKASKGGITGTTADVRLIMAMALKSMATCIIISHNHPSGNLSPSTADKVLTTKIKTACNVFEITLLDHIIVTPHSGFYSFCDEGKL
jgi:DNA repair protein RadC